MKGAIAAGAVAVLAGLAQGAAVEKRYTTVTGVQHTFYGCK